MRGHRYIHFLLGILGILLLEAALFWSAQRLVEISSTVDASNLLSAHAAFAALGSEHIHNLIKGAGAGALVWLLLYGADLYRA